MANPSTVIGRSSLTDRVGFWAATLTAILAAVSFGVAATTPPRTGPFAAPGSKFVLTGIGVAEFVVIRLSLCHSGSRAIP